MRVVSHLIPTSTLIGKEPLNLCLKCRNLLLILPLLEGMVSSNHTDLLFESSSGLFQCVNLLLEVTVGFD